MHLAIDEVIFFSGSTLNILSFHHDFYSLLGSLRTRDMILRK
jgi:hypothetical protein